MADGYAAELIDAKRRLAKIFGKSFAKDIFTYSLSIVDTENYIIFTKYVRKAAIDFLHAYLLNIICQDWQDNISNLDNNQKQNPLEYIKNKSIIFQRSLHDTALTLVGKRLVFDYMSTQQITANLINFFSNLDSKNSIRENIKDLVKFKSKFTDDTTDAKRVKEVLELKLDILEELLKTYLTIKEAIYKELGYDVVFEYNSISDFNFSYNDSRLQERNTDTMALEYQVIEKTIQLIEPDNDGDIVAFLQALRPEVYSIT